MTTGEHGHDHESDDDARPDGTPPREADAVPVVSSDPEPPAGGEPPAPAPRPEPSDLDVDALFAGIIAGWGDDTPAPRPDRRDSDAAGNAAAAIAERAAGPRPTASSSTWPAPASDDMDDPGDGELVGAGGPRDFAPSRDEGRFIPPDPPPLPRGDLISRLAWAGALLCPALLIFAAMFWKTIPEWLLLLAVAGSAAGFIALVARLPHHRNDDDDGAVV